MAIRDEECGPSPHWSQQYLNSKVGFRHLVQRAAPAPDVRLPAGVVCTHVGQACATAISLLRSGHDRVILKADREAGGFGQFVMHSGVLNWDAERQASLARLAPLLSPLLSSTAIVVETWVEHSQRPYATPSVTMEVEDQGIDCVGTATTFMELGATHAGAVVGNGAMPRRLERSLATLGYAVAGQARAIGYRGPMTIDAVIDGDDQVSLLEINARRTMVTHCHSLRRALFDEACKGAVASYESARIRGAELGSYAEVRRRLDRLWYRSGSGSGLLVSLFAPRLGPDRDCRLSLVAVNRDASSAVDLLRQAFTYLSVGVRPQWRRRGGNWRAWRQVEHEYSPCMDQHAGLRRRRTCRADTRAGQAPAVPANLRGARQALDERPSGRTGAGCLAPNR